MLIKFPRKFPTTAAKNFAANCIPLPNRLMFEVLAAAAYGGFIPAMGQAFTPGARTRRKKKGDEAATSSPLARYGAPVKNGNRGFSATPDAVAAGLVSIFTAPPPLPQAHSESKIKATMASPIAAMFHRRFQSQMHSPFLYPHSELPPPGAITGRTHPC
jgi:hypothetical protein